MQRKIEHDKQVALFIYSKQKLALPSWEELFRDMHETLVSLVIVCYHSSFHYVALQTDALGSVRPSFAAAQNDLKDNPSTEL